MKERLLKICWVASLVFLTGWLLFFKTKNYLDSDEGIILGGAWRLYNGERIYLDFFEYSSPGSFYLLSFFWKIFGSSYFLASIIGIINILAVLIAIYFIAKKLDLGRLSFFAPLLYLSSVALFPFIGYNFFVLTPLAWSVYFFICFLQNNFNKYLFLSGLLAGLSGIFLQHRFAVLFITSIVFLLFNIRWIGIKKTFLNLFIYCAGVIIPLLLLLFWPLFLLYQNLLIFPASNYLKISEPKFFLFGIILALLISLFLFFGKNKNKEHYFLYVLQFFLLISISVRPDKYHIFSVIFPLIILSLLFLKKFISERFFEKTIWLLRMLILFSLFQSIFILSSFLHDIDSSRNKFLGIIQYNCFETKYLYAGPFLPGLYFDLRKENPSRYNFLLPGFNTDSQLSEALSDIVAKKPACVVLGDSVAVNTVVLKNNLIEDMIYNNYEKIAERGKLNVYKIKNK